ncbi:unnamed protein product [Anisakis simplex]|uniref:Uncharacterized protein n=1 Tax=Anisakis simplex TaxID=6269 RepID=A0A3P6PZZ4_ANISI|nr:unnamed protein product [Anisakis simplex]
MFGMDGKGSKEDSEVEGALEPGGGDSSAVNGFSSSCASGRLRAERLALDI